MLAAYVALRVLLERRYLLFDPDEALEMLAAQSLLQGRLPYLGALSHRGPFLTVLYSVPCALFGGESSHGVHAFAIVLFVALSAWLQRCVALATNERVGLLTLSSLLLLGVVRVPSEDNWGLDSDFLMGGLVMAAMSTLLASRRRELGGTSARECRAYFVVGGLLSLALLTKQNAAPFALVPLAYIAVVDRARAFRTLACLAGGFAAPLLLAAATYAGAGELRRAWYFFYEYNRAYAGAAFTAAPTAMMAGYARWFGRSYGELFGLSCLGWLLATRDGGEQADDGLAVFLATTWALAGLVAATVVGKHWDNYLWASHAPVALLAALGANRLIERARSWMPLGVAFAGALAIPLVGCLTQLDRAERALASATEVGGIPPPRVPRRELVRLIDEASTAADFLYVTGYAPEMYILAARRPASRHVISNFVETVYPGRFGEPSTLSPAFFAELRGDLAASRPPVVLDACALGFLCHPSSALTAALPGLLVGYHPMPGAPSGVFIRDE